MRKMIRTVIASTFAVLVLSSCSSEPETPQACVERFTDADAGTLLNNGGQLKPIFTYDITETTGFLEELGADGLVGVKMTLADSDSGPALEAFLQDDVPEKGALFGGDGVSFFRIGGDVGSYGETIEAGCKGVPDNARLIRIDWEVTSEEVVD